MEESKRIELERVLEELGRFKGRHTELISVYVPAGHSLVAISKQLEQEKATAQNIKSKPTRKNVMEALEKLIRHLKLYKATPKNGLALFCGNIAPEGTQDIRIWAIEPPQPLRVKTYRCDQVFLLDPLKEMLKPTEVYGLLVLDRKEATFGLLEGKSIRMLKHLTSGVPGKIKAGGQSAARFSRLTEEAAKEFYRRVSQSAKDLFFEMPKLKGILVGGPGPTKEEFLKEGNLLTALKEKIIAVKDLGYADESALDLLVESSKDVLKEEEIIAEKKLLEKFFTHLSKEPEKVAYGEKNVNKALEIGAAEELLISSSLEKSKITEFEKKAREIAAKVTFVSTETEEGRQFENLGKVGAFLRFEIV